MSWIIWVFAVVLSSVNYQTSAKIFAGKLPIFVYTTIVSITMLVISLMALAVTYKTADFSALTQKNVLLAVWLGFASFMIDFSFYFLYKNNAPLSLARMVTLVGSAIVLLIIGVVVFKEKVTLAQLGGMGLSLAGMYLIIRK